MVVNYWYVVKEKERHADIWLMSISCGNYEKVF